MMISTLEDPKASRSARTAPDLLDPLALLALACPLAAMGCWEYYGLDHPLTHAGNGLAALSLLLLGLNERYNPQPWLPTALRTARFMLARRLTQLHGICRDRAGVGNQMIFKEELLILLVARYVQPRR